MSARIKPHKVCGRQLEEVREKDPDGQIVYPIRSRLSQHLIWRLAEAVRTSGSESFRYAQRSVSLQSVLPGTAMPTFTFSSPHWH